ncbi:MAG: methionine adenosyltransferase [Phycisphaerae bacterium]
MADAKTHLFTSESVTRGHPDKVADQISDAVLDSLLAHDPKARVACETLVTTGLIVLAGEVTVHTPEAEKALLNVEDTVRDVVRQIGYVDPDIGFDYRSCSVLRSLHSQSPDISQGVTEGTGEHLEQGAGDQGLMFGFACRETSELMPLPIQLSHRICSRLTKIRESGELEWLRPDGKGQVTVEYDGLKAIRIDSVVLSTQHTVGVVDHATNNMSAEAKQALIDKVIKPVIMEERPDLWTDEIVFHINPTGRFVVGGPHGDAGLTGRKLIVDTYGGRGRHGGGAFSGKDPSKVDRSATYMARYIAKNIVAADLADVAEVQIAYAIGVAEPVSVLVDTQGTIAEGLKEEQLAKAVRDVFPLKPAGIIQHLDLLRPIYCKTAYDGHFGRVDADFSWEQTDKADLLRQNLGR